MDTKTKTKEKADKKSAKTSKVREPKDFVKYALVADNYPTQPRRKGSYKYIRLYGITPSKY